jgi:inorganic pyrophosphatase
MNDLTDRTEARERLAHPWHGVNPMAADGKLTVFIENVQFDVMKYETDAATGLLKVDQPLQTSALPPFAYGFVPRTLCGRQVAAITGGERGDRAPLDVFVLSERAIGVPGVLADVYLVGGIRVRDEARVDDKLLAVLNRDVAFAEVRDIGAVPIHLLDRVSHFLSQNSPEGSAEVGAPFDRAAAERLLAAAMADYLAAYPD